MQNDLSWSAQRHAAIEEGRASVVQRHELIGFRRVRIAKNWSTSEYTADLCPTRRDASIGVRNAARPRRGGPRVTRPYAAPAPWPRLDSGLNRQPEKVVALLAPLLGPAGALPSEEVAQKYATLAPQLFTRVKLIIVQNPPC